jgi:hypothetical protein
MRSFSALIKPKNDSLLFFRTEEVPTNINLNYRSHAQNTFDEKKLLEKCCSKETPGVNFTTILQVARANPKRQKDAYDL